MSFTETGGIITQTASTTDDITSFLTYVSGLAGVVISEDANNYATWRQVYLPYRVRIYGTLTLNLTNTHLMINSSNNRMFYCYDGATCDIFSTYTRGSYSTSQPQAGIFFVPETSTAWNSRDFGNEAGSSLTVRNITLKGVFSPWFEPNASGSSTLEDVTIDKVGSSGDIQTNIAGSLKNNVTFRRVRIYADGQSGITFRGDAGLPPVIDAVSIVGARDAFNNECNLFTEVVGAPSNVGNTADISQWNGYETKVIDASEPWDLLWGGHLADNNSNRGAIELVQRVVIDFSDGTSPVDAKFYMVDNPLVASTATLRMDGVLATTTRVYSYTASSGNIPSFEVIVGEGIRTTGGLQISATLEDNWIRPRGKNVTALDTPASTNGVRSKWEYAGKAFKYGYQLLDISFFAEGGSELALTPVLLPDLATSEANKSTVDAYTEIETAQKFKDRADAFLEDNFGTYLANIVSRNGNVINAGALNITIDATAGSAFAFDGSTITIKSDTFVGNINTSGTVTLSNGAILDGVVNGQLAVTDGATYTEDIDGKFVVDTDTVTSFTISGFEPTEIEHIGSGATTINGINNAKLNNTTITATGGTLTIGTALVLGSEWTFTSNVLTLSTGQSITNFEGIKALAEVSYVTSGTYTTYTIDSAVQLVVDGTITHNPDQERLVITGTPDKASLAPMVINGTYNYGLATTVGPNTAYTRSQGLVGTTDAGSTSGDDTIYTSNSGTFIWDGGVIALGGLFTVANGGTLTQNAGTYINTASSGENQFRLETNNSGSSALINVNNLILTGTNDPAILLTNNSWGTMVVTFENGGMRIPAGGGGPTVLLNPKTANNIFSFDIEMNINDEVDVQEIQVVNPDKVMNVVSASSSKNGLVTERRDIDVNLKTIAGGNANATKYYSIDDYDNGGREIVNGIDYTADNVYSGTSASGLVDLGNVMIRLTTCIGTATPTSEYRFTDAVMPVNFCGYEYLLSTIDLPVYGNGTLSPDWTMLPDTSITEATKATVDAYTTIDSSRELYDRAKADLYDNFLGETATTVTRTGTQIDLLTKSITVNNGGATIYGLTGSEITIKSSNYTGGFSNGTINHGSGNPIFTNLILENATWNAEQATWTGSSDANTTIDVANSGIYDATGFTFDASSTLNNSSGGEITVVLSQGATQPIVTGSSVVFTIPPTIYTINSNLSGFYYALLDVSNATPNGTDPSKLDGVTFVQDEEGDNIWGYVSGTSKVISRITETGETSFIVCVQKPGHAPILTQVSTDANQNINAKLEPYTDSAGNAMYTGSDTDSGITDVSIGLSVGVLDAPKIYISDAVTPTVYGIFVQLSLTYTSPLGFLKLASGERQSLLSRIVGLSDSLFIGDAQLYGEGTSSALSGYISTTKAQIVAPDAEFPVSIQKILGVDDEAAKLNAYQGFIHVDAVNGTDSNESPYGTPLQPCKTLANAQVLANTWGIRGIKCLSAITADVGCMGLKFYGDNIYPFDMNNQEFTLCGFHYVRARGVDAETSTDDLFEDCLIDANISCRAVFRNCMFDGASTVVTLMGGPSDFLDCNSRVEGTSSITVDNSGNFPFNVRGWKGGVNLINMTSGELSFGSSEGRLTIDASCGGTAGIVVRGNTRVVNNSSIVINTDDKGYVLTDGLETKAQADARQVLLIAEHNATKTVVDTISSKVPDTISLANINAEADNALSDYGGPKKIDLIVRTATAQAGTSTTITLDAEASAVNSYYNNTTIYVKSGTGAGQSRRISAYVGSTKVATVANSWQTIPNATSVFNILPRAQVSATLNSTQSAQLSAIETKTQADARQALLISAHGATQTTLSEIKGGAWSDETLVNIKSSIDALALSSDPVNYTSTSAVRTEGDDDGGDNTNVQSQDNIFMVTGETINGLEVLFTRNTSSINEIPTSLRIVGFYSSNSTSHNVRVQVWNYTHSLWDSVGLMADRSDSFDYVFPLNNEHHNGSGEMQCRLIHNVVGDYKTQHSLNIDYIVWQKVESNEQLSQDIAQILAYQQELLEAGLLASGEVASSTTNTITLGGTAEYVDGSYDPAIIKITSGAGAGQTRNILEYIGSTRTAVVNRDWKIAPDNTSTYVIHHYSDAQTVNEGLAQGGTSNTLTLNANASNVDDTYIGQLLFLVSGTGQDQTGLVVDYDGTSKVATIAGNWTTTPTTDTAYIMLPASPVLLGDTNHSGTITKLRNQINAI